MGIVIVPKSTTTLKPSSKLHIMEVKGCRLESSVALVRLKGRQLTPDAKIFVKMFK
jgi:hypothetical protein